jgi:transcriptional regulator with XRE-family HTH domain
LRARQGLSQRELGELTGIEPTTISALERGAVTDPRVSTVKKLAAAFGCPLIVIIRAVERSVADGA